MGDRQTVVAAWQTVLQDLLLARATLDLVAG